MAHARAETTTEISLFSQECQQGNLVASVSPVLKKVPSRVMEPHESPEEIPLQESADLCPDTGSIFHWSPDCNATIREEYILLPGTAPCTALFVISCLLPPLLWFIGPLIITNTKVHPEIRARFLTATILSVSIVSATVLTFLGIMLAMHIQLLPT